MFEIFSKKEEPKEEAPNKNIIICDDRLDKPLDVKAEGLTIGSIVKNDGIWVYNPYILHPYNVYFNYTETYSLNTEQLTAITICYKQT